MSDTAGADRGGDRRQGRQLPQQARANLFSTVLDAMTDGVMVVDDRLRLVVSNRSLRDTLLLGPNCHGMPLAGLLHDQPALVQGFESVLAGGGPRSLEIVHRSFVTRLLDILLVPLPDHEYWGHRALGVVRDVTERRDIERMQMEFIANASHELRTPTATILGWAETLVDAAPADPAKLRSMHEKIHRHAQRMHTLLGQLLDISRLDHDQWQFARDPVEIGAFLEQIAADQADQANAAGLSVSVQVAADLPTLHTDRNALAIVAANLLQNAIKYTPTGGRIELRSDAIARPRRRDVRIAVADSGIGIAQEHQARIFERFYRVDKGRTRHVGGAGLGLAIVANLVSKLGGQLELHSAVGKGSTFSVTLPAGGA